MFSGFWQAFKEWNHQYFIDYFLIFLASLTLFGWLQASPTLPEPDSFYHAKMAQFLGQGQVLRQFPWMQATALKDDFVDHHFLYHLLLAPFVKIFDPLMGVKIATVLFASLLVLIIYWLFKKFAIKWPFIFIVVLLAAQPWLFRVSLVKAPAVFLILFLLAFNFLAHQKWLALFLIGWLAVWLYAGWPLLLVLGVSYLFIFWLLEKFRAKDIFWHKLQNIFLKKSNLAPWFGLAWLSGGLLAGLILNPYFPSNLKFYWQQIIEIALINYQKIIGVGGEWYPYGLLKLVTDAPLIFSLLIVGWLLFILTYRKQSIYSYVWGILAIIFFILTLKSRRYVEFFVPFSLIFSAFCLSDCFKRLPRFNLKNLIGPSWQAFFSLAFLILAGGFLLAAPSDLAKAKVDIKSGWPTTHYQQAGQWLKSHAPAGSVVFNADWDDFPALFYYNDRNYYLTGLDPTFMYRHNQQQYWQYVELTQGRFQGDLAVVLKNQFKADYIFLDKDHQAFNNQLKYDSRFKLVYQDREAKIYQLLLP